MSALHFEVPSPVDGPPIDPDRLDVYYANFRHSMLATGELSEEQEARGGFTVYSHGVEMVVAPDSAVGYLGRTATASNS